MSLPLPTNPYPFHVSGHSIWLLKRILEIIEEWSGADHPFYVDTFSDIYPPTTKNNYNAYQMFSYLSAEKILTLYQSDESDLDTVTTPSATMPELKIVTRYKISITDHSRLRDFYNQMITRSKVSQIKSGDKVYTRLIMDENELQLHCEGIGSFGLWRFNPELQAYNVVRALCSSGLVERRQDQAFIGIVESLSETLRGCGFTKEIKHLFFSECTRDRIKLKGFRVPLTRTNINFVIIHFHSQSARVDKSNDKRLAQNRKINQPNPWDKPPLS